MDRLRCLLRRHAWGPVKTDEAGPYQTCKRCQKVRSSRRVGPDGYDAMPPQAPPSMT